MRSWMGSPYVCVCVYGRTQPGLRGIGTNESVLRYHISQVDLKNLLGIVFCVQLWVYYGYRGFCMYGYYWTKRSIFLEVRNFSASNDFMVLRVTKTTSFGIT